MYYSSIHDHLCQSIHDEDGGYDGDHGDGEDLLCMHVCVFVYVHIRSMYKCTYLRVYVCIHVCMDTHSSQAKREEQTHTFGETCQSYPLLTTPPADVPMLT